MVPLEEPAVPAPEPPGGPLVPGSPLGFERGPIPRGEEGAGGGSFSSGLEPNGIGGRPRGRAPEPSRMRCRCGPAPHHCPTTSVLPPAALLRSLCASRLSRAPPSEEHTPRHRLFCSTRPAAWLASPRSRKRVDVHPPPGAALQGKIVTAHARPQGSGPRARGRGWSVPHRAPRRSRLPASSSLKFGRTRRMQRMRGCPAQRLAAREAPGRPPARTAREASHRLGSQGL